MKEPSPKIRARYTLRWKFTILFLILCTFGSWAELLSYHFLLSTTDDITQQQLHAGLAPQLVEHLQSLIDSGGSYDELVKTGDDLAIKSPGTALHLFDSEGRILLDLSPHTTWDSNYRLSLEPVREFLKAPFKTLPVSVSHPGWKGKRTFSAALLQYEGKPAYLVAFLNASNLYERARGVSRENTLILQGFLLLALSLLATLAMGFIVIHLFSRRFVHLTSVVQRYRDGELGARADIRGQDESALLGAAMNEMAGRIEQNIVELENRDMLRRELISNVSHDLRGPATQIQLGIESIERGELSVLDSMKRSSAYLERLLEDLFQLSQLESAGSKRETSSFSLEEIFEDLQLQKKHSTEARRIALRIETSEPPPQVSADQALVARLFANLLENAIRYTPDGGTVLLFARTEGESIRAGVSDSGRGISRDELPHIFDRFYRGKEGRALETGSTGLGLAIVKRIAELHGTVIAVETEEEKGTTFSLLLRRAPVR